MHSQYVHPLSVQTKKRPLSSVIDLGEQLSRGRRIESAGRLGISKRLRVSADESRPHMNLNIPARTKSQENIQDCIVVAVPVPNKLVANSIREKVHMQALAFIRDERPGQCKDTARQFNNLFAADTQRRSGPEEISPRICHSQFSEHKEARRTSTRSWMR